MKMNKSTIVPMLVTAGITIALITAVNNMKALKKASDALNGKSGGWFS